MRKIQQEVREEKAIFPNPIPTIHAYAEYIRIDTAATHSNLICQVMKTLLTWILLSPLLLIHAGLWGQDTAEMGSTDASLSATANWAETEDPANDPKLYYNPFSEKLVIEQTFHTTTRVSLKLVDAKGRTVYEKKDQLVYPGLNKMIVSLLESLPGRYFVYINIGKKEYIKTLVTMP